MHTRGRLGAGGRWAFPLFAGLLALATIGCGGKEFQLGYGCSSGEGVTCESDSSCQPGPGGPDTCGNPPGFYGHDPIPIDGGVRIGCVVFLPYDSPQYPGEQQICFCEVRPGTDGPPFWGCPG